MCACAYAKVIENAHSQPRRVKRLDNVLEESGPQMARSGQAQRSAATDVTLVHVGKRVTTLLAVRGRKPETKNGSVGESRFVFDARESREHGQGWPMLNQMCATKLDTLQFSRACRTADVSRPELTIVLPTRLSRFKRFKIRLIPFAHILASGYNLSYTT